MFFLSRSQSLPIINVNISPNESGNQMFLLPMRKLNVISYRGSKRGRSIAEHINSVTVPKYSNVEAPSEAPASYLRRPHWRECVRRLSTLQRPLSSRITCLRTSSAFHDMTQSANQRYDAYVYEISRSPKSGYNTKCF